MREADTTNLPRCADRALSSLDLDVVYQARPAQSCGRQHDHIALAILRRFEVRATPHGDVIGFPAMVREFRHHVQFYALIVARTGREFVARLTQQRIESRRFPALL